MGGGNAAIPGLAVGEWDWKDRNVLTPMGACYRAADSGRVCGFTEPWVLAPVGGLPASAARLQGRGLTALQAARSILGPL